MRWCVLCVMECQGVKRVDLGCTRNTWKIFRGVTDRSEVDRWVECGCLESREGAEGWLYRGSEIKFG